MLGKFLAKVVTQRLNARFSSKKITFFLSPSFLLNFCLTQKTFLFPCSYVPGSADIVHCQLVNFVKRGAYMGLSCSAAAHDLRLQLGSFAPLGQISLYPWLAYTKFWVYIALIHE